MVDAYEYTPYGQPLDSTSAIGNEIFFGGQRYDRESGYYYMGHRYYDPVDGRFITPDPLGAWADPMNAGNAYAYAGNSPWNYDDPTGLFTRFSSWDTIDEIIDPNSRMPIPSRLGGAYALYAGQSEFAAELGIVVNASYCLAVSNVGRDILGTLDPTPVVDSISAGIYIGRGEYGNAAIAVAGIFGLDALKALKYGTRVNFVGHNGSLYEVIAEYAVDGTTRGQHRNQANRAFYEFLRENPEVEQRMSQFLLGNGSVLQQMRTAWGGLRNPYGTEWHHPSAGRGLVQLLRVEVHRQPLLQHILHPNGYGGFWWWH